MRNRSGNLFGHRTINGILVNEKYTGLDIINKRRTNFDAKHTERLDKSEWIEIRNALP